MKWILQSSIFGINMAGAVSTDIFFFLVVVKSTCAWSLISTPSYALTLWCLDVRIIIIICETVQSIDYANVA
jgi:hypothetical protein